MEVIENIKALLGEYGTVNVLIMIAIIVIVNLIKIPIKSKAGNIAEFGKNLGLEVDKAVITSYIAYLPFIVAAVLFVIKELIIKRNNINDFDYMLVIADSIVFGGLSIATYELVSINVKRLKYRKSYKSAAESYNTKSDGDLPIHNSGEADANVSKTSSSKASEDKLQ